MGIDEYIAYLHARVETTSGQDLRVTLTYDDHYCRYFREHTSRWKLGFPGWSGTRRAEIDGRIQKVLFRDGTATITIPAGLGKHAVSIFAADAH